MTSHCPPPRPTRHTELAAFLRASRARLAPADVGLRPATIAISHPRVGLIGLQMFQLRLVDQPGLLLVIQVPASRAHQARVRSLLADISHQ